MAALEDFLQMKAPRKEYVSMEPIDVEGEVPLPKPMAPTAPVVAPSPAPMAQPIVEENPRLEEIKRVFSPAQTQPIAEEPMPMQQAPQPEVQRTPASSGSISEILPYLAPLAVEALFGGKGRSQGESFGVSGKAMVKEAANQDAKRQKLEEKLLDLEKSKLKNAQSGKRYQSINIVDPNTKQVMKAVFDQVTGQHLDTQGNPLNSDMIRAGYAVIPEEFNRRTDVRTEAAKETGDYFGRGIIKDPETGLLVKKQDSKLLPIQESTMSLNPKQQKDAESLAGKFLTTDVYKKSNAALAASKNISGLLEQASSGNAPAAESAKVQLARMSGDVGALSDTDISRYGGSPALKMVAKRYANLQKTGGTLLPRDIENLKEIASIYERANKDRLSKSIGALDQTFQKTYGAQKGAMTDYMKAFIPDLYDGKESGKVVFPLKVTKGNNSATVSNEAELEEARQEGWK